MRSQHSSPFKLITRAHRSLSLPGLAVVVLVVLPVVVAEPAVVAVAGGSGGEETSDIDEVEDDSEEDEGAEESEGGGGGAGVQVEEPGLAGVQHGVVLLMWGSHGGAQAESDQEVLCHHPERDLSERSGEIWQSWVSQVKCRRRRVIIWLGAICKYLARPPAGQAGGAGQETRTAVFLDSE